MGKDVPKLASGFSVLILSRQSWLKNIYADMARLGALGSFVFLPPRGVFSLLLAALRDYRSRQAHIPQRQQGTITTTRHARHRSDHQRAARGTRRREGAGEGFVKRIAGVGTGESEQTLVFVASLGIYASHHSQQACQHVGETVGGRDEAEWRLDTLGVDASRPRANRARRIAHHEHHQQRRRRRRRSIRESRGGVRVGWTYLLSRGEGMWTGEGGGWGVGGRQAGLLVKETGWGVLALAGGSCAATRGCLLVVLGINPDGAVPIPVTRPFYVFLHRHRPAPPAQLPVIPGHPGRVLPLALFWKFPGTLPCWPCRHWLWHWLWHY